MKITPSSLLEVFPRETPLLADIKLIRDFSNDSIMVNKSRGRPTELDYHILQFLLKRGPSTLEEISAYFSKPKSTCGTALARLEKKGFVKRFRSKDGATRYDITSKEAVKSYLNRVDKIRKKFELESEKLPILMRHSYEALIKHPSAIEKFVTPLHYREFDLEDWLEFLNLSEVDRSHPFFDSLDEFVIKIVRSDIFEKLIMIRIVGILRDLTILYYYYWSAIVRSSTRDELNEMLLKILMENSKELALYQELVEEKKTSCKNSFANDIIRELSKIMLEILRNQVIQQRISVNLNAPDVISEIDKFIKTLCAQ